MRELQIPPHKIAFYSGNIHLGHMVVEGCDPPMGGVEGEFHPSKAFDEFLKGAPIPKRDEQHNADILSGLQVRHNGAELEALDAAIQINFDLAGKVQMHIGVINGLKPSQFQSLFKEAWNDYWTPGVGRGYSAGS